MVEVQNSRMVFAAAGTFHLQFQPLKPCPALRSFVTIELEHSLAISSLLVPVPAHLVVARTAVSLVASWALPVPVELGKRLLDLAFTALLHLVSLPRFEPGPLYVLNVLPLPLGYKDVIGTGIIYLTPSGWRL